MQSPLFKRSEYPRCLPWTTANKHSTKLGIGSDQHDTGGVVSVLNLPSIREVEKCGGVAVQFNEVCCFNQAREVASEVLHDFSEIAVATICEKFGDAFRKDGDSSFPHNNRTDGPEGQQCVRGGEKTRT